MPDCIIFVQSSYGNYFVSNIDCTGIVKKRVMWCQSWTHERNRSVLFSHFGYINSSSKEICDCEGHILIRCNYTAEQSYIPNLIVIPGNISLRYVFIAELIQGLTSVSLLTYFLSTQKIPSPNLCTFNTGWGCGLELGFCFLMLVICPLCSENAD